jgi:hypothetical protein
VTCNSVLGAPAKAKTAQKYILLVKGFCVVVKVLFVVVFVKKKIKKYKVKQQKTLSKKHKTKTLKYFSCSINVQWLDAD